MHSVTLEYVLQILADTGQPLYVFATCHRKLTTHQLLTVPDQMACLQASRHADPFGIGACAACPAMRSPRECKQGASARESRCASCRPWQCRRSTRTSSSGLPGSNGSWVRHATIWLGCRHLSGSTGVGTGIELIASTNSGPSSCRSCCCSCTSTS